MKIGITGHQKRAGIDWTWVAHSINELIASLGPIEQAYSSLAAGSDQIFAQCALDAGVPLTAVIPTSDYETFFDPETLRAYKALLGKSRAIYLEDQNSSEESFFAAGRYVAQEADLVIAVWDEKPAAGLGGTADVVEFARASNKKVVIINPITKIIIR